jgi:hypothetical protein
MGDERETEKPKRKPGRPEERVNLAPLEFADALEALLRVSTERDVESPRKVKAKARDDE